MKAGDSIERNITPAVTTHTRTFIISRARIVAFSE